VHRLSRTRTGAGTREDTDNPDAGQVWNGILMVELEIAAAEWKSVMENASLDRHPSIFVAHYGPQFMGSVYATRPSKEPEHVLILCSPFAVCNEVTDTFVFIDRPNRVMVSRLNFDGKGVRISDWDLPYMVSDGFQLTLGVATMRRHPDAVIRKALDDLGDHRLKGRTYGFNEAYWHSIRRGAQLEDD